MSKSFGKMDGLYLLRAASGFGWGWGMVLRARGIELWVEQASGAVYFVNS